MSTLDRLAESAVRAAPADLVASFVLVPGSGADAEPDVGVLRTFQGVSYDEVARRATRHASGMLLASLEDVRAWKCVSGRPKDLDDIAAIDRFLDS